MVTIYDECQDLRVQTSIWKNGSKGERKARMRRKMGSKESERDQPSDDMHNVSISNFCSKNIHIKFFRQRERENAIYRFSLLLNVPKTETKKYTQTRYTVVCEYSRRSWNLNNVRRFKSL